MLNILNFDKFVFTRILRLKSKCNKTDVTKKTSFKLRNAFFVVDVVSKFSKNFFFRFLQHISKNSSNAAKFINKSSIEIDKFYKNLKILQDFDSNQILMI